MRFLKDTHLHINSLQKICSALKIEKKFLISQKKPL